MAVSTCTFLRNIALLAVTILVAMPSNVNAGIDDPEVILSNWHEVTAGKRILIKYFDPYCDFSNAFQDTVWLKLEAKYKDDPDIKMIEVNCQSKWGLQTCIDHDTEHTPELHYGDTVIRKKYIGSGNYDVLVDFIEKNLRKPFCSLVTPEGCPEEEREGMLEIEKLTMEYFKNLSKFTKTDAPNIANQAVKKFGIKNPWKVDFDEVITDEDYEFPELMFDGRPKPL